MDFIIDNFDKLFDSEENFKKLEEIILDLAVKGKLVPQHRDDEPASVLLEKIKAEKEKLIKEKKIKRDVSHGGHREHGEVPFEIPDSWEWVRLGEIIEFISGTTINEENLQQDGEIPYVKVSDMNLPENIKYIVKSQRYVNSKNINFNNIVPKKGIVFPKRGGAIATNKKRIVENQCIVDANTMAITIPTIIDIDYFYIWFHTIDLWELNTGTSVP